MAWLGLCKTVRILIHRWLVLWVQFPVKDNFNLADFETPQCQFCTKMPEMSDLCYLGKTRLTTHSKNLQGCHHTGAITYTYTFFSITSVIMHSFPFVVKQCFACSSTMYNNGFRTTINGSCTGDLTIDMEINRVDCNGFCFVSNKWSASIIMSMGLK